MIDTQTISNLAAAWGAFLSTILALKDTLSNRPSCVLEFDGLLSNRNDYPVLVIRNISKWPISLTKLKMLGNSEAVLYEIFVDQQRRTVINPQDLELNLYLYSNQEARISLIWPQTKNSICITVFWLLNRPINFFNLPMLIFKSQKTMTVLKYGRK